jgi:hypothetical protein
MFVPREGTPNQAVLAFYSMKQTAWNAPEAIVAA